MASDSSSAFFSLTQAEYAAGNFKQKVAEGSMSARIRVGAGVDNVAGVKLPVFTKYDTGAVADNQSLGLVGGGKKIVAVREKFSLLLENLIKYVKKRLVRRTWIAMEFVVDSIVIYHVQGIILSPQPILILSFSLLLLTDLPRFKPPL